MRKGFSVGFGILAFASMACAQSPVHFGVHQLTPTVYWVDGGGGEGGSNSGFIVGKTSVIVFDAKMTLAQGKELLKDIAEVTPKPVKTVIISHSDLDHVTGLAAFPKDISIIAHENMKKELEADPTDGGHGLVTPDEFPNRLVTKNREDLDIDGVKLELLHWAPAHTSGDLVLYLPAGKIVFAGDMLCLDFPGPLIHMDKHGTYEGWMETFRGMTALDSDRFVPGHGDLLNKASVETILNNADAEIKEIKKLVAQGKSLDQVEMAVDDPPSGAALAKFPKYRTDFPTFSQVVYRELTHAAPAK